MGDPSVDEFWGAVNNALQHLYGRPQLSDHQVQDAQQDTLDFLFKCKPAEFFDFIEMTFKLHITRRVMPDENDIVDSINDIFRLEEVPYQLTPMVKREVEAEGYRGHVGTFIETVAYPKIARMENEVLHEQAIEPALALLSAPDLQAANAEFRDAMDRYRRSQYRECVTYCTSACESVMKVLCERNRWPFESKDTISRLCEIVVDHTSLSASFKQAITHIGTIRNSGGMAHGAGSSDRDVPRHVAEYTLAVTAAALVLLVHEAGNR